MLGHAISAYGKVEKCPETPTQAQAFLKRSSGNATKKTLTTGQKISKELTTVCGRLLEIDRDIAEEFASSTDRIVGPVLEQLEASADDYAEVVAA